MTDAYRIDFDEDDDGEFVGAPLREEAQERRARERAENARIVKAARDRAWGYAAVGVDLDFRSAPATWHKSVNPWTTSLFTDRAPMLKKIRDDAVEAGIHREARHADHLLRQVTGKTDQAWNARHVHRRGLLQTGVDDIVGSVLLRAYGPDPRLAFIDAMAKVGIIPSETTAIAAGNTVRRFHVLGDACDTRHGWSVLHRCPGAGTFGSLRTRAVHHWHWQPERMPEFEAQFEDDIKRAMTEINSGTGACFSVSNICQTTLSASL